MNEAWVNVYFGFETRFDWDPSEIDLKSWCLAPFFKKGCEVKMCSALALGTVLDGERPLPIDVLTCPPSCRTILSVGTTFAKVYGNTPGKRKLLNNRKCGRQLQNTAGQRWRTPGSHAGVFPCPDVTRRHSKVCGVVRVDDGGWSLHQEPDDARGRGNRDGEVPESRVHNANSNSDMPAPRYHLTA